MDKFKKLGIIEPILKAINPLIKETNPKTNNPIALKKPMIFEYSFSLECSFKES